MPATMSAGKMMVAMVALKAHRPDTIPVTALAPTQDVSKIKPQSKRYIISKKPTTAPISAISSQS